MNDDNNDELAQYYTINFEKFIEMIKRVEALHYILTDLLQDHVVYTPPDTWEISPISDLCGFFAATNELKTYLDDIINNPTEEEIEISTKYNITDVLISLSDLNAVNILFGAIEEYGERLQSNHKIVTTLQ